MVIDKLNKYRSYRSFGWSICSLQHFIRSKTRDSLIPYLASMLILGKAEGNEEFFESMGFAGLLKTHSITSTIESRGIKYLKYLYDLLEEPERSGDYTLNGQMFASAVRECLDLYLCNRSFLQKQRSRFNRWRDGMRRTTPWLWRVRFGTRNRNHPWRKIRAFNTCHGSRPLAPPGMEGFRIALYEWALMVFPFFLERSTVSLELAEYLSRSTFSIVSVRFPYLTRLAKVAILKYSMRAKAFVSHSQ